MAWVPAKASGSHDLRLRSKSILVAIPDEPTSIIKGKLNVPSVVDEKVALPCAQVIDPQVSKGNELSLVKIIQLDAHILIVDYPVAKRLAVPVVKVPVVERLLPCPHESPIIGREARRPDVVAAGVLRVKVPLGEDGDLGGIERQAAQVQQSVGGGLKVEIVERTAECWRFALEVRGIRHISLPITVWTLEHFESIHELTSTYLKAHIYEISLKDCLPKTGRRQVAGWYIRYNSLGCAG